MTIEIIDEDVRSCSKSGSGSIQVVVPKKFADKLGLKKKARTYDIMVTEHDGKKYPAIMIIPLV